jgi:hypothetical protein
MKGSEVIDGEWQTAPRKRTIKTSATPKVTTRPIQQGAVLKEASPPYATIIRQVEVCKASLEVSEYFGFVSGIVSHGLPAGEKYDSIVALGIGSLVSPTSQLQLALCLCLCKLLLTSGGYSSCSVFDPVLTDMDRELYLHLGIPVLTVNSKGKHSVTARTLFFMPHCPYRLYCNVLWANWENLERIHIFGNRLVHYFHRFHACFDVSKYGRCFSVSSRMDCGACTAVGRVLAVPIGSQTAARIKLKWRIVLQLRRRVWTLRTWSRCWLRTCKRSTCGHTCRRQHHCQRHWWTQCRDTQKRAVLHLTHWCNCQSPAGRVGAGS